MNIYISFLYFTALFAVVYSDSPPYEEDLKNVIKVKILGYLKNGKCYQRWYLVLRHEVLTEMKPKICSAIDQRFDGILSRLSFGSEYCRTDIFDDLHPDGAVRVSVNFHIPVDKLKRLNGLLSVVDVLGMFTKYLLDSQISDEFSRKIEVSDVLIAFPDNEMASYRRTVMDVKTNLCKPVPIDHNYDHRKLILMDGK
uniref:Uncharacterized protein n=1 Tax=Trichobilharzia regenti TaxID=157069 RepID=A0AA85IRQ3_TRIRE|nr:unnamed protein product [Trichobilharzia regenti]